MIKIVLKVTKLGFHLLLAVCKTFLVLLFYYFSLVEISFKEVVQSLNPRQLKHAWKLQHHNSLIIDMVYLKHFGKQDFD